MSGARPALWAQPHSQHCITNGLQGIATMDCLIIYSRDGEKRFQTLTTRFIPNMKAVEFTVLNAELSAGHQEGLDATGSVRQLIQQLGIEIIDVLPVRKSCVKQGAGMTAPPEQR
ncbi:hypothetical protein [Phytopseudomonas daroniae]|uniref:hypothetical protein n=1 Tax=Phytopseudomonas daroniae TaxID=2487519 RepID=UPI0010385199|nr:hypothetical protein [Pseudomonas daroniae]